MRNYLAMHWVGDEWMQRSPKELQAVMEERGAWFKDLGLPQPGLGPANGVR